MSNLFWFKSNYYSYCRACDCQLTLYDNRNYGGLSLIIKEQNADFGVDWYHDRAESAKVGGTCTWLAYGDGGFRGHISLLEAKDYPTLGSYGNTFSSARVLPPPGTEAIVLFADSYYSGRMVVLYDSNPNLASINFDDTMSSFIVTGGSFTIYADPNYYGSSGTYGPGTKYPNPPSGIGHDTISSVKKN